MASRQIARNVRGAEAKEFVKLLESLSYARHRWDVFSDWCVMASSAIYNRLHQDPAIEEQYLQVAKKYTREELDKLARMLGLATAALADERQDFMGEVYEGSLLASAGHGQFFTPFSVSRMVAAMNIRPDSLPRDRIVSIMDPAAGAGGLLIAAAAELEEAGFDYVNWAYFEAKDIDPTCARMAYIQLSLIGASAVVICGDTLRMTTDWAWATPAYWATFMGGRLKNQREREAADAHAPESHAHGEESSPAPRTLQLELSLA